MDTVRTLYIVDDAADYRFLLDQLFTRFITNCAVRFFDSANALYQHLITQTELPDLILLDLHLPGLSGYQMLTMLKQRPDVPMPAGTPTHGLNPRWSRIPVIMFTNANTPEEVEACYAAGANSFLNKPLQFNELQILMETVCQYWTRFNQLVG